MLKAWLTIDPYPINELSKKLYYYSLSIKKKGSKNDWSLILTLKLEQDYLMQFSYWLQPAKKAFDLFQKPFIFVSSFGM